MAHLRLAVFLLTFGPLLSIPAQEFDEPDRNEQDALRQVQRLLDATPIDSADFRRELPLEKFIAALQQHLPSGTKLALKIDRDAFGDRQAELAARAVSLPAPLKKISLRFALERAIAKSAVKADYRIGAAEVAITTPARARYIAGYDIRPLVAKPEPGLLAGGAAPADPATRAGRIVQTLVTALGPSWGTVTGERESIQILNGTRLVIRASAAEHAQIDELLQAFRRLGDLAVAVDSRLYEVDDAFFTKLKNAKRVPLEELERIDRDRLPPRDELFTLLPKQRRIQAGDPVTVDNGQEVGLLSRQRAVLCLPSPEQAVRGDKGPQAVVEGVAFVGRVAVSPDRRFVRIKLTEKDRIVQEIRAEDARLLRDRLGVPEKDADKELRAEVALLKDAVYTQMVEIPDGGSILIPVQHRPAALAAQGRWYVLYIAPRIIIEEEERAIFALHMEAVLPAVVSDLLTNPRLKSARDFVGTPGDGRFALVNSAAWTWPEKYRPEIAGHTLTPAEATGKRLLGIRVEQAPATGGVITAALVNAGGNANGAVFGGCTLRYNARETEQGPVVELAEVQEP